MPSDVPIIYSNDGFYINSHRISQNKTQQLDLFLKNIFNTYISPIDSEIKYSWSKPYKYKIRKNDVSLRTLSLIHPRAQTNWVEYYSENGKFIAYNCSKSTLSIRSPHKVANSFYSPGSNSKQNKYKEIIIETLEDELTRKHAGSYFAYKGFDRIYKFFSSSSYLNLEKKFSKMSLIDVSNCFDSIYTHSISWAVKNKEYIKDTVKWSNQACQKLDTLMQRSNNNETNGIPIGSEGSRIFAEFIFQKVDLNITDELRTKHNFKQGIDYEILRYVDDFIVFAKNENNIKIVIQTISDNLNDYNLYLSEHKHQEYSRPFLTKKSAIIHKLNFVIETLEQQIFLNEDSSKSFNYRLKPNKIGNKNRVINNFIESVKFICNGNDNGYADASSYLISTFSNRLIRLQETEASFQENSYTPSEHINNLHQIISILFELIFFLYTVNPTVTSSNKLAKTIIITDEFYGRFNLLKQPYFRTLVMNNQYLLPSQKNESDHRDGFLSLERLNVILSTCEFGKPYLLPVEYFEDILNDQNSKISYFNFICLLYYFKHHPQYQKFIRKIEAVCLASFRKNKELLVKDSELLHLFLDLLCCPYVSNTFRIELISIIDDSLDHEKKSSLLSELDKVYWFVKWEGLNLISLLERKELNSVY